MKVKIYLKGAIINFKNVLSILPPYGHNDKWVSIIKEGEISHFEVSAVEAITFEEEKENDVES